MDQAKHTDSQNGFQQRIANVLSLSPDEVAIEAGEQSVTWRELQQASNEVIALLEGMALLLQLRSGGPLVIGRLRW